MTDTDINREIDAGAVTLEQLRIKLNVATSCGRCSIAVVERLESRLELALSQIDTPKALA